MFRCPSVIRRRPRIPVCHGPGNGVTAHGMLRLGFTLTQLTERLQKADASEEPMFLGMLDSSEAS